MAGNCVKRTNIPNIRVAYRWVTELVMMIMIYNCRYETLMDELSNVYSKPLVTSGDTWYTNGH